MPAYIDSLLLTVLNFKATRGRSRVVIINAKNMYSITVYVMNSITVIFYHKACMYLKIE